MFVKNIETQGAFGTFWKFFLIAVKIKKYQLVLEIEKEIYQL